MSRTESLSFRVVQFVHPGFEYRGRKYLGPASTRSGVMDWKEGRTPHDRKFMLSRGSLLDPTTGRDDVGVPLCFWGEWEGPSAFWRIGSTALPEPRIVHAPFRPTMPPQAPVQNTDPMVFGDAFIYSNCMQEHYEALRNLSTGSIVLFGRFSNRGRVAAFSLDTCLVVDSLRRITPIPFEASEYGRDLLEDAVLKPLYTEGARDDLRVFFGRRFTGDRAEPFSFFPARRFVEGVPAFARPQLRPVGALASVVNPKNMQGIKSTEHDAEGRDAIWHEIVRQVMEQGCTLGYHAEPPPLLSHASARRAVASEPRCLG